MGLLDRIRKPIERIGPAGAIQDALAQSTKTARDSQYAADEKKYGPRIADEEMRKRTAAAASRSKK